MSIDIARERSDGSKFLHAISSQNFYDSCWAVGIKENNLLLLHEYSEFSAEDIDEVLKQLNILKAWAEKQLSPADFERMAERIEQLKLWLPIECENEGGNFYYI